MKRKLTFIAILTCSIAIAQVGIGTTNPQADLHVGGDILVQEGFKVNNLNTVDPTDEDFMLVSRVTNSSPVGEIKVLNVGNVAVAPVNTIDMHFTNISLDNLSDVDLQYDTSKYIVSVANFRYVGDPIKKVPINSSMSIGNFVVNVFESGGTWHLEIRNRSLDLNAGDSLDYYVTLVVYNKAYFRNLSSINTDLGGNNTGSASSIPNLY
ncbi:MAG: hypothetical protein KJO23_06865 [Bacteroidia bacterium]|nr:hypothetical protein [Bacteroidia bacterium]NNM22300.1 hypothetical protein [Flavobacteriaceae bacterium]